MDLTINKIVAERLSCKLEQFTKEALQQQEHSMAKNTSSRLREVCNYIDRKMTPIINTRSFINATSFIHKKHILGLKYSSRCVGEVIEGQICIDYCDIEDPARYGVIGYPGHYDGDLCQDPIDCKDTYRWDAFKKQWELYKPSAKHEDNKEGFLYKLQHNAAFEPLWGNNPTGEDLFSNGDQKANGEEMWGTLPLKSPLGTFKKLDFSNVMKTFFHIVLNFKKVLSFWDQTKELKGNDKSANKVSFTQKIDSSTIKVTDKDPKMSIPIEKIKSWRYFRNNGHIDETGVVIIKDTLVSLKNVDKVNKFYKDKNQRVKSIARKKFENEN